MIAVLPSLRPEQASLMTVASAARLLGHELGFLMIRSLDGVAKWHARLRERAALIGMDDRMLKDIGLSRADIAREAQKPFWRP